MLSGAEVMPGSIETDRRTGGACRGGNRCDGGRLRLDGGRVWWRQYRAVARVPREILMASARPYQGTGLLSHAHPA